MCIAVMVEHALNRWSESDRGNIDAAGGTRHDNNEDTHQRQRAARGDGDRLVFSHGAA